LVLLPTLLVDCGCPLPGFCGGTIGLGLRWPRSAQSTASKSQSPHLPALKASAWKQFAVGEAALPADQRLQRIMRLTPGEFEAFGNAITASKVRYGRRLKEVIETCCNDVLGEKGVLSFKAGSLKTKTAIDLGTTYSGSDLDVNVKTTNSVTRSQRTDIASCFARQLDGVRIGKKCIKLEWRSGDVDVAFTDTQFKSGVIDRGAHFQFFENCPKAQTVVKMLKFSFRDARGLSGFMLEGLLMEWSELEGMGRWTSLKIFEKLLEVIHTKGPVLREVLQLAKEERDAEDPAYAAAYAREQRERVERMQNVIKNSGVLRRR